MSTLPIEQIFPELLSYLAEQPDEAQLIIGAPPGAGKSTALPLMLLRQAKLDGQIVMLEPRRLAARNIASYLAGQLGEPVGKQVGYQMRGETKASAQTKLLIVTEGVLNRKLQSDPELSGVAMLIFDEFHERSLQADLGLALSLEVQQAYRPDLCLVLMSATLDLEPLQALLPKAKQLISEGRSYPIEHRYHNLPRDRAWLDKLAQFCLQTCEQESGNILVFLPGAGEIRQLEQRLSERLGREFEVHPLYGQLKLEQQQAAIAPPPQGKRKIVLATNVAETSLTIEGISCVIDSGLERQASFHPASATTRLQTRMVCRSSAIQRAGRAGRLQAGRCYHLYSEEALNHRPFASEAEILRSDLSDLCLNLAQWGAQASELSWLDAPPKALLAQGYALLDMLGLAKDKQLTKRGLQVSELGMSPRIGAMLLQARSWQERLGEEVLVRACELAALLESGALPRDALSPEHAQRALQGAARQRYSQLLERLTKRFKLAKRVTGADADKWDGLLLAQAFPDRIATKRSLGAYTLAAGFGVSVDGQHRLARENYLVVADLFWREGQAQGQLALGAALDITELERLQPERFSWQQRCQWSGESHRIQALRCWCLGNLVLKQEVAAQPSGEALIEGWREVLAQKGLAWLPFNEVAQAWLVRARCAQQWFERSDWPGLDQQSLFDELDEWLLPYLDSCRSWGQLQKLDWQALLSQRLSWEQQQQLASLAPTHYQAPSGRKVAIRYSEGQAPVMAVKLQEMFGEPGSPMLGNKVKLTLELLSPAGRPLQLTQDLASFWQNAYQEVKKEMKGRYPKHPWPDDPTTAVATRKTKRMLGQ